MESNCICLPLSLGLFIPFLRFSKQECWSCWPFPSPVDHLLSELSTLTCPSWVSLQGVAHSFIKLHKSVIHVIILVGFLWLWFSFYLSSDGWGWGLCKLPDGRDWLWGKLGLALVGKAMLSKSLIQFMTLSICLTLSFLPPSALKVYAFKKLLLLLIFLLAWGLHIKEVKTQRSS